jgi:adenylate kinase family enzyme
MSKGTFVVNLIGGPGIGKTTMSAIIFANLKLKKYSAEYVQEYAKQLVWMKKFSILNNQYYVTQYQYDMLKQLNGLVDYVVTDGPLIGALYYNLHNSDNTSNVTKTNELILNCYNDFKNINIFLTRGDYKYEEAGRTQKEEESKEIDIIMKHLLKANKIEYTEFSANTDPANINKILEFIENQSK